MSGRSPVWGFIMRTVVTEPQHQMGPKEPADFYSVVPEKCPKCGGKLKDYNAETAVTPPGVSIIPTPALIAHLFICADCREKLFAPPEKL